MNVTHLKYAVAVEECGSISQAAEKLYMGQPNLSKAIRELEEDVGLSIFSRTKKGVVATDKGREFLSYARSILMQLDEMESMYKPKRGDTLFSLAAPRASYVSYAFSRFAAAQEGVRRIDMRYLETSSLGTVDKVAAGEFSLGVMRYPVSCEEYFLKHITEKGLKYRILFEYNELVLMSGRCPLAQKDEVSYAELSDYTEILHGDFLVPSLSSNEMRRIEGTASANKIYVYERGSQFDLLANNPRAYMWVSPVPDDTLRRGGFVQRRCSSSEKRYRDTLVYLSSHILTEAEKQFERELLKVWESVSI